MICLRQSFFPVVRALAIAVAVATAQPAYPQDLLLSRVSSEELREFAERFRSAIEAGNWQKVESLIMFPLRVNTGPGKFYFVSRGEFISEYGKVFNPGVRAAILGHDAASLEKSWRLTGADVNVVSVAAVCTYHRCSKPVLKVVTVDLREK